MNFSHSGKCKSKKKYYALIGLVRVWLIAHWRKTKSCPCRGKSSLKKVNFISSTSLSISYFVWRKFYDSCVDLIISWWFYFLLMLNANRLTIKMCKEVLAQNPTIMILIHNKIGFHLSITFLLNNYQLIQLIKNIQRRSNIISNILALPFIQHFLYECNLDLQHSRSGRYHPQ